LGQLGELARVFLKLGLIAFGGPAAHIAMMEEEFVVRRRWLGRQHFLDLIGATNLIPGPNSTEMTMHVGYERAGWPGLVVAGGSFILPAVLITAGLAWLYVEYGALPEVAPLLFGIKPAVIAVILGAVWRLGKTAVKGWRLGVLGLAIAGAVLGGVGEITALLVGGAVGALWLRASGAEGTRTASAFLPILFLRGAAGGSGGAVGTGVAGGLSGTGQAAMAGLGTAALGGTVGLSLWKLFFFFRFECSEVRGSGWVYPVIVRDFPPRLQKKSRDP